MHDGSLCYSPIRPKESLGVESNHRFRHIRATCFRYTTERCFAFCIPSVSRDGRNRTDFLVFPETRGRTGALHPECLSLC